MAAGGSRSHNAALQGTARCGLLITNPTLTRLHPTSRTHTRHVAIDNQKNQSLIVASMSGTALVRRLGIALPVTSGPSCLSSGFSKPTRERTRDGNRAMTRTPRFVCCVTPLTSRRVCLSVAMFKLDRGVFARIGLAQRLRSDDIVDTGLCAETVHTAVTAIYQNTQTETSLSSSLLAYLISPGYPGCTPGSTAQ